MNDGLIKTKITPKDLNVCEVHAFAFVNRHAVDLAAPLRPVFQNSVLPNEVGTSLPGRFLQKDADHEGDPLFTLAVKSTKMRAILAFRRLEPCHEPSS